MPRLIYLNPVSPTTICKQSDINTNYGTNPVDPQDKKTGCMKWYIYGETNDKYIAILDHNTTAQVSNFASASTQLTSDTSNWNSSITRRLITADEVAKIAGADTVLNFSASLYNWFYLDGSYGTDAIWQTQVANTSNKSYYAWLYDYLAFNDSFLCTTSGCNYNPSSTYYSQAYWTSSSLTVNKWPSVWAVSYEGDLNAYARGSDIFGVRPVIEFDKSILQNRG